MVARIYFICVRHRPETSSFIPPRSRSLSHARRAQDGRQPTAYSKMVANPPQLSLYVFTPKFSSFDRRRLISEKLRKEKSRLPILSWMSLHDCYGTACLVGVQGCSAALRPAQSVTMLVKERRRSDQAVDTMVWGTCRLIACD